jgi:hypothetical protein
MRRGEYRQGAGALTEDMAALRYARDRALKLFGTLLVSAH